VQTQWYAVQASQLVLFTKHLSAFHRNDGLRYNVLTGPGEVLMAIITLLAIRATFGLDWFINIYEVSLHKVLHWFDVHNIELPAKHMEKINNVEELGSEIMMTLYYVMYMTAVIKTSLLKRPHGWSRELFGGVRNRHFRRTRTFCFFSEQHSARVWSSLEIDRLGCLVITFQTPCDRLSR